MSNRQNFGTMVLLTALCASSPSQTVPSASEHTAIGKVIAVEGVGNFGEVTPHLYRGAQPNRVGFEKLAKMGIDIVVDVRLTGKDDESREVHKLGMQFVSIPWHCYLPKDKVFARFLILLQENPGRKIFVHCRYGDDRTGMMIAAYRIAFEGWTAKEARKEMEQFGFHRLVCPSLGPYEKDFPAHLKTSRVFRSLRPAPNSE
jgi:hypothetical protein